MINQHIHRSPRSQHENGTTFTTNALWFKQMGERVSLYQEEDVAFANHSIYKETDLLALGALLEKRSPNLSFSTLIELLNAGCNDMKASYEGALNGLRSALLGNTAPMPSTA